MPACPSTFTIASGPACGRPDRRPLSGNTTGNALREYSVRMPRDPSVSPIGEAMAWVSRIMAIGLMMFLPGVAGGWLDGHLGTRFLGPLGFAVGLSAALLWLAQIGGRKEGRP